MLTRPRSGSLFRSREGPSWGEFQLRSLGSRQRRQAWAVVESAPILNVHVGAFLWTLESFFSPRDQLQGVYHHGELIAVVQHCRGVSWAASPRLRSEGGLLGILGTYLARQTSGQEVVIGPAREIDGLVPLIEARGLHPVEIRHQQLMAVSRFPRPRVLPSVGRFELRNSDMEDLPWLLETHAAMCREDLGVDQVARNPAAYDRYFSELVREGRSFIGETGGIPVFKAEMPLESPSACLVEGVYTLPRDRGRGFASHAMATLVRQAARRGKRACLYVHVRNVGAIRLYERLGFRAESPWRTMTVGSTRPVGGRPAEY